MTHDADLGRIDVTAPEVVARIHFLNFVENESHVLKEDVFCELANRNTLRSSIRVFWPIGFGSDFTPIREHRYQRIWGVIGCRDDEAVTRQSFGKNCISCWNNSGAVLQKNQGE